MSGMAAYFLRRLLLVPVDVPRASRSWSTPCCAIVPGGPIEQAETRDAAPRAPRGGRRGRGRAGRARRPGSRSTRTRCASWRSTTPSTARSPSGTCSGSGSGPGSGRTACRRSPRPPTPRRSVAWRRPRLRRRRPPPRSGRPLRRRAAEAGEGRILGPEGEAEVPEDVRREAARLYEVDLRGAAPASALPRRARPRRGRGVGRGRAPDLSLCGGVPRPSGRPVRRRGSRRSRRRAVALAETERATGYCLDEDGKPTHLAFRPLRELAPPGGRPRSAWRRSSVRGAGRQPGAVYRPLTEEERRDPARSEVLRGVRTGWRSRRVRQARRAPRAARRARPHLAPGGVLPSAGGGPPRPRRRTPRPPWRPSSPPGSVAEAELARIEEEQDLRVGRDGTVFRIESAALRRPPARLRAVLHLQRARPLAHRLPDGGLDPVRAHRLPPGVAHLRAPRGVQGDPAPDAFDTATSVVVFVGYAIPGFVVCLILLSIFGAQLGWLPLGGYKPDGHRRAVVAATRWSGGSGT